MITFDQLRCALLGPQPPMALDNLVRGELAAGRKTKAIYDELLGHLDSLRTIPEYTDHFEDMLGDTLDALSGWVHPDFQYKDDPGAPSPSSAPAPDIPFPSTPKNV